MSAQTWSVFGVDGRNCNRSQALGVTLSGKRLTIIGYVSTSSPAPPHSTDSSLREITSTSLTPGLRKIVTRSSASRVVVKRPLSPRLRPRT